MYIVTSNWKKVVNSNQVVSFCVVGKDIRYTAVGDTTAHVLQSFNSQQEADTEFKKITYKILAGINLYFIGSK